MNLADLYKASGERELELQCYQAARRVGAGTSAAWRAVEALEKMGEM